MNWFWFALGAAFFQATADYLVKRHFSSVTPLLMSLIRWSAVIPLSLGIFLCHTPAAPGPGFWSAVMFALPAELLAAYLYIRAIQSSPLALSQPFLAFTPLFALFTGFVILGEFPAGPGLAGIALLTVGAYGLNLHQARGDWTAPFKAVARETGSWLMLTVALLYAYTAVWGRAATLASAPLYMIMVYPPLVSLGLAAVCLARRRRLSFSGIRPLPVLAMILCMSAMFACHFAAINLIQTAYMVSVKRLSLMFAMLYGGLLLGEERLMQHLSAGAVMAAGAALILLAS